MTVFLFTIRYIKVLDGTRRYDTNEVLLQVTSTPQEVDLCLLGPKGSDPI